MGSSIDGKVNLIVHYAEKAVAAIPAPAEPESVAGYLRSLANQVEAQHVVGFKVDWQRGQGKVDSTVTTAVPANHIAVDLTL